MLEEKTETGQLFSLAVQHHRNGNFGEAERLYKKILQVDPKHFQSIVHIGILANQFKKYEVAKQLFLEALQINPQFADAHYNLGNVWGKLGEDKKALSCYERALQINPQFVGAHDKFNGDL